jgi:hypothetical protein
MLRLKREGIVTVRRWFLLISGAVLALVGAAKVYSGCGYSKALFLADPIFSIPFRHLMISVGTAELVTALLCLSKRQGRLALWLVAWLSTNFAAYRFGLWFLGWHRPCGCLGNLTDMLHISPVAADGIMKAVLAFLLLGSYTLLLQDDRAR